MGAWVGVGEGIEGRRGMRRGGGGWAFQGALVDHVADVDPRDVPSALRWFVTTGTEEYNEAPRTAQAPRIAQVCFLLLCAASVQAVRSRRSVRAHQDRAELSGSPVAFQRRPPTNGRSVACRQQVAAHEAGSREAPSQTEAGLRSPLKFI